MIGMTQVILTRYFHFSSLKLIIVYFKTYSVQSIQESDDINNVAFLVDKVMLDIQVQRYLKRCLELFNGLLIVTPP